MGSAYGWGARMAALAALAAGLLAGCGGQDEQPVAPRASAAPVQAAARLGGDQAVALVNDVCRALATGRPAAIPKRPSGTALSAYVNVATPAAQRMITSLERLSATYRVSGLEHVLGAYTELRATYASAAARQKDATAAARMIRTQEGVVSTVARSAQLPACAVGSN